MIEYALKINNRSRRMRLSVGADCKVNVTVPRFVGKEIIENFINEKSDWIKGRIEHFKTYKTVIQDSRENYLKHKESARIIVAKKVEKFSQFYNLKYNRIVLKIRKVAGEVAQEKGI